RQPRVDLRRPPVRQIEPHAPSVAPHRPLRSTADRDLVDLRERQAEGRPRKLLAVERQGQRPLGVPRRPRSLRPSGVGCVDHRRTIPRALHPGPYDGGIDGYATGMGHGASSSSLSNARAIADPVRRSASPRAGVAPPYREVHRRWTAGAPPSGGAREQARETPSPRVGAALATAHRLGPRDTMAGEVIGSYRIIGKIGEGGMGAVYLAEHALIGRRAAIKVLLREMSHRSDLVTRFFNEARAATAVKH